MKDECCVSFTGYLWPYTWWVLCNDFSQMNIFVCLFVINFSLVNKKKLFFSKEREWKNISKKSLYFFRAPKLFCDSFAVVVNSSKNVLNRSLFAFAVDTEFIWRSKDFSKDPTSWFTAFSSLIFLIASSREKADIFFVRSAVTD